MDLQIDGLGVYDEACLKALYELQKEQGVISYMTYEDYKEAFRVAANARLEKKNKGIARNK